MRILFATLLIFLPLAARAQNKPCNKVPWPAPEDWQQASATGFGWGQRDPASVASARTVYIQWDDSISDIDRALPKWAQQRWTQVCQDEADLTVFLRWSRVMENEEVAFGKVAPVPEMRYLLLGYDRKGRLVHYQDSETLTWVWSVFQKLIGDGEKKLKKAK